MGRSSRRLFWAAAIFLGVVAPSVMAEPVRIGGSGSGLALTRALFEAFHRTHPQFELWMPDSVGTGGAIRGLEAGGFDIGVLLRPLGAGELPGGRAVEICRTPFVFFVSATRSDVRLGRDGLADLFLGQSPYNLRPVLRPEQETNSNVLLGYFPGLAEPIRYARQQRGRVIVLTDRETMDVVEQSSSLIGAGAYAPLVAERRRLLPVPLDGVAPTLDNLASGRYPYASQILLAVGPTPAPAAMAFVAFATSPEAGPVLRENGCLPGAIAGAR